MQVTIKSPIPVRPLKVYGEQPIAVPSLESAASPLVTSAAVALSPYPSPREMPVASAIIFFSAPQISIPLISVLV